MRLATRRICTDYDAYREFLVIVLETEEERKAVDEILGDCGEGPVSVDAEVRLSDDLSTHYIKLERNQ